jgi:hypothetical protein
MNKVILRAITAYARTDMKSASDSVVSVKGRETDWLGKAYVVLEDDVSHRHVAVYRCMNRGELKRLKRWPPGVTAPVASKAKSHAAKVSAVPAILELSPVKTSAKTTKSDAAKRKALAKNPNVNQTDLFE